jgi:muramoyltetrapeptide carboxypeptidase LdcA involved in peptidoglycan recycling
MSGRLLGGCVDLLVLHTGTKYDKVKEFNEKYKEDGVIWFFECCDLNPLDMRRAFWNLRESGWLDNAKGFLIGRPLHFGEEMMGVDQYNAVTDILGDLNVPIVMDLDIGHLPPMMPIITGSFAEIKAKNNEISINYKFI